jgi:hypothetical protein
MTKKTSMKNTNEDAFELPLNICTKMGKGAMLSEEQAEETARDLRKQTENNAVRRNRKTSGTSSRDGQMHRTCEIKREGR